MMMIMSTQKHSDDRIKYQEYNTNLKKKYRMKLKNVYKKNKFPFRKKITLLKLKICL